MKKLATVFACLVVLALAAPVYAVDDWSFELGQMRYRFDHEISSVFGTDDSQEYMDDDFDTLWIFKAGDVTIQWELEIADNNLGDDNQAQSSWDAALGAYSAKWTPADSGFSLEVGDFGTSFGRLINNDDSPHGSIEVAWNMGEMELVVGYGKISEGDTNDDVEGDEHLFRGQIHMPVGESFNMGAYAAMYTGSDLVFADGVIGDRSVFLGAVEFSGAVGNMDVYSEVGFASGTTEESGAEVDLSGFYAMGGVGLNLGPIALGVEGGFASGDDDPTDDKDEGFTAVNSDFWLGEIMHDEELITRTNGSGGGLSNLLYAQVTADASPSEKLDVSVGLIYLAPVEEVDGVDSYGTEIFGSTSYKLTDYAKHKLYFGYAMPNEDFIEDPQFQVVNRLEFAF